MTSFTVRAIPVIDEQHLHRDDRDVPGEHDVEAASAADATAVFRARLRVPADFEAHIVCRHDNGTDAVGRCNRCGAMRWEPDGWLVTEYGFERVDVLGPSENGRRGALRLPIRMRHHRSFVDPLLVRRTAEDACALHDRAATRVAQGDYLTIRAAAIDLAKADLRGTGD